jgi:hypothetical protein
MSMSTFDPNAFLDMPVDEVFVKRPPLPIGDYTATIQEISARQWTGKEDPTKTGLAYDLTILLEIPEAVATMCNLTKPNLTLKDSVMVDLTTEGAIDSAPGRNRQLRAYRDALDMNKAGVPFRAREMAGRLLKVRIKHDIWPLGSDNIIEKIAGVSKL